MAIAGATTAVVAPPMVPVALLGSTAPDWLEWVFKAVGRRVKHRTVTHYVAGGAGEYGVAGGIVLVCVVVGSLLHSVMGWYPFFYDWAGLYETGVIDGIEWKANRFRFL